MNKGLNKNSAIQPHLFTQNINTNCQKRVWSKPNIVTLNHDITEAKSVTKTERTNGFIIAGPS